MSGGNGILAAWGFAALYVGVVLGFALHSFMGFVIGAGGVVGLCVALLVAFILFNELRNGRQFPRSRGRAAKLKWSPIRQPGERGPGLTITGWMTLQRMQDERRLSYQLRHGLHHLFHPEEWALLGNDPDNGSNVWTQASLESSTTEQARAERNGDRLAMWLVILMVVPCVVAVLMLVPVILIFPAGVSTWKFVWMDAAVSVALIVALIGGGYAHDRIALRARRKAQLRAALIKHP